MKTSRRSQVDPFIVMDVMEAAQAAEAAGRHIIHLEVGQPGTAAPEQARAALTHAMAEHSLGYTVALGLPELRSGIADLYARWYGVKIDPARVVVTSGSSAAFLLAFTALFDTGARVGLTEPGYPSYRQILKAQDLVPVGVPTQLADGHLLQPKNIPQDVQGMIVASPSNPTGAIMSKDQLSKVIATCEQQGTAFISDEIYHGLHYDQRATTALEITDDVYVINSFSKYFSMTGWRIGWMIVPQDHVRTIERLAQNMFICAPHAAQVAALGALEAEPDLEKLRSVYAQNRALMLEGLPKAGFTELSPPDGAFYVYADVTGLTDDSRKLCADILDEVGVAVTPGLDFDPIRGAGTVRFSYARATADIEEGMIRLRRFAQAQGWSVAA